MTVELFLSIAEPWMTGIAGGVSAALLGWGKNKGAEFDGFLFGRTIAVGIIAGAVMVALKIDYNLAVDVLIAVGLVEVIEKGLKTVYRRFIQSEAPVK